MMNNKNTEEKLNKIIEEQVNPILNEHLGGVVLTGYEDGTATVKFTGNCRTCYAAEDTLDNVVRGIILEAAPEVNDVQLDDTVSEDLLDFARSLLSKEK